MRTFVQIIILLAAAAIFATSAYAEKICPKCGKIYVDKDKFCGKDGTQLLTKEAVKARKVADLLNRAKGALSKGQYSVAITLFGEVQQLDSSNAEARDGLRKAADEQRASKIQELLSRGDKAFKGGNYREAQEAFQAALNLDRTNAAAAAGTSKVREASKAQEINALIRAGDQALKSGAFEEAIRTYEKVLDMDASNAAAATGSKKAKEAAKAQEISALIRQGDGAFRIGAYDEAIAAYSRVLVLDASYAEAMRKRKEASDLKEEVRYAGAFIPVKSGCFQMGDTFGDGNENERPVHEVCVDDFAIGKYEVTQGQWKAMMGTNPSFFSNCGDNCPVESISWYEVQAFLEVLGKKTGKKYRLPTEAEWEYAARSGGRKERWAGTAGASDVDPYGWYSGNSGGKTHPVGQKQPNGLGIYDMAGNVRELTADCYSDGYAIEPGKEKAAVPKEKQDRVRRGGSIDSPKWMLRNSSRGLIGPDRKDSITGFRVVRE